MTEVGLFIQDSRAGRPFVVSAIVHHHVVVTKGLAQSMPELVEKGRPILFGGTVIRTS